MCYRIAATPCSVQPYAILSVALTSPSVRSVDKTIVQNCGVYAMPEVEKIIEFLTSTLSADTSIKDDVLFDKIPLHLKHVLIPSVAQISLFILL